MDEQIRKLKETCLPCKCYIMTGPRRCRELGNAKFLLYASECPCIDCIVKVMCHMNLRDFCPRFERFKNIIIIENGSESFIRAIGAIEDQKVRNDLIKSLKTHVLFYQSLEYSKAFRRRIDPEERKNI